MQFFLKNQDDYTRVIVKLSALTTIGAFACMLMGYLFLPLASAAYAALLVYEKSSRRVISYALPIVLFTVNLLLNGIFSLEGVIYVAIGLIMFFSVKYGRTKGETVFWVCLAVTVFILLSAIAIAFDATSSVSALSIKQFYSNLYINLKSYFIDTVTALTVTDKNGTTSFAYNVFEAESLFNELVVSLVSVLLLASLILTGLALKLFVSLVNRYACEESEIVFWNFKTSNLVAIFYIVISVISFFLGYDSGIFAAVIVTLNTLFSAVFAYIGLKFVFYFITSHGKSKIFAVILIVIISVLISSFAVLIFSYIGVYVNIVSNRVFKISGDKK